VILAPGIEFHEEVHEYWYKGKQLSGITGRIASKLGLKMPQEFMAEYQEEGTHVHKAVQNWIGSGDPGSVHPSVVWITQTFWVENYHAWIASNPPGLLKAYSEVLVSDFKQYASAVDIIVERGPGGDLDIFDIKNGVFKRDYVTDQLSAYKYLIERYAGKTVRKCICISARDEEYYPIFPKKAEEVEKWLYGV
jgi:hypothetical protein